MSEITKTITFQENKEYEISDIFPMDDAPYVIINHLSNDDLGYAYTGLRFMTKNTDILKYMKDEILKDKTYTSIDIESDVDLLEIEFIQGDIYQIRVKIRDVKMINKLKKYLRTYKKKYNLQKERKKSMDKFEWDKYLEEKDKYIKNIFKLCGVSEPKLDNSEN